MRFRLVILALAGLVAATGCEKPFSPIEVTSIVVADASGTGTMNSSPLQFSAAILPADATNRSVTWSVTDDSGDPTTDATIDANGILSSTDFNGVTYIVTATANDGSGVSDSVNIFLPAF
jgi:hypothetical protein